MKANLPLRSLRNMLDAVIYFQKPIRREDRRVELCFKGVVLTMTATCLGDWFKITNDQGIPVQDETTVIINPSQLRDVLKQISRNTSVTLKPDNGLLKVEDTFFCQIEKSYKPFPILESRWTGSFGSNLIDEIALIRPALYEDESRPGLQCVSLESYPGGHNLVGTDGHRIHYLKDETKSFVRVSIPDVVLGMFDRVLPDFPIHTFVVISSLHQEDLMTDYTFVKWGYDHGDVEVIGGLLANSYPDWRLVKPNKPDLRVPVDELLSKLKPMSGYNDPECRLVIVLAPKLVTFFFRNAKGIDTLLLEEEVRGKTTPCTRGFNVVFFWDYLTRAGAGAILNISGSTKPYYPSPVVLTSPTLSAVIMPVHLV